MVQVTRMGGDGRIAEFELFDIEQWDDAVGLFEQWTAPDATGAASASAGADDRTPEPENAATRIVQYASRLLWTDLDAALTHFSPEAVGYARETGPTAGASAEDPARWLDVLSSLPATYDELRFEPLAVRGDRLALLRQEFVADGFVTPALLVVELDEQERISRLETFGDDDLAGAAEHLTDRYLALRGADLPAPERYLAAAFAAWQRQDYEAFTETMDPGFVRTDRGAIGMGVEGRDAYVANMREFAALVPGAVPCPATVYASEHAVITVQHTHGTTGDGSELAWDVVYVMQVTPAGRAVEMVTFDAEQWDEALALFDAWSAEPTPAGAEIDRIGTDVETRATRLSERFLELVRTGRERELVDLIADGYTYVDRRFGGVAPPGQGTGADELFRAYGRVGMRFTAYETLAVRGERLALIRQHLTSPVGDEIVFLNLTELGETDRMVRTEIFDESDLGAAVARLDEWYRDSGAVTDDEWSSASEVPDPELDNECVRATQAMYASIAAGDGVAATLIADDVDVEDRRTTVSLPHLHGRDEVESAAAGSIGTLGVSSVRPIAVRGERLALFDDRAGADGFEIAALTLAELDEDGRLRSFVMFDESERAAAIAELDARYEDLLAEEADAEAEDEASDAAQDPEAVGDAGGALWSVLDRHDVDVLDRIVTPAVTFTDHLSNGLPSVRSAAALVKVFTRLFGLAPDTRFSTGPATVEGSAAMLDVEQRSTAPSGTEYRWDRVVVVRCADDGRVDAIECFTGDARADAEGRRSEWSGAPDRGPQAAEPADGVSEAFARRDWDWIRSQISDDVELVDHRSTVNAHAASGADAVVERLRGFADVGFVSMRNELVESRGERVLLFRRTYRTEDRFELVMLAATERDATGMIVGMVVFDADDLAAARAELDRRSTRG